MSQLAQEERAERVPIGAFVDREQRDELVRLARDSDCSMSRIVRRALASELERISTNAGVSSPRSERPQTTPDAPRRAGCTGSAGELGAAHRAMRSNPDLIVAVADGLVVDDYGVEHRIMAGRTRWHRHDALELRRDEVARLFGLEGDGFTRSRPSPAPALEREIPELRHDATPKVTVTVGRIATEAIREELRRDDRLIEVGHLETGGCLVADIKLGGRSARIVDATWPGGPGRGYDQVRISEALGEEVAANYREWSRSDDVRMVGLLAHASGSRDHPLGAG